MVSPLVLAGPPENGVPLPWPCGVSGGQVCVGIQKCQPFSPTNCEFQQIATAGAHVIQGDKGKEVAVVTCDESNVCQKTTLFTVCTTQVPTQHSEPRSDGNTYLVVTYCVNGQTESTAVPYNPVYAPGQQGGHVYARCAYDSPPPVSGPRCDADSLIV